LSYRFAPTFQAGVEFNAAVGEVGPIANWFALTETDTRPAVIFGTSSDRIGTPEGKQAYYVTFSKQIGQLPVAPYMSVNYSGTDRGFNFPFGASIQIGQQFVLTPMYDGHASHTVLTWSHHQASLSLIAAWNRRFGVSVGYAF
jgi:hypothetical protein